MYIYFKFFCSYQVWEVTASDENDINILQSLLEDYPDVSSDQVVATVREIKRS